MNEAIRNNLSALFNIILAIGFLLVFPLFAQANVPPPPANQQIGIPDGIYNNLEEADCRLCHENPDQFPVEPKSVPDRHHLIVNTLAKTGTCSVSGAACQPHAGVDCPQGAGVCRNASGAPFPPPPGRNYNCFSCHNVDCSTGMCSINVYRDCTFCHYQNIGETGADVTVHHLTPAAEAGNCVYCHGDLVDNMDDGHIIPSYEPSLATPGPSGGDGMPLNSEGNGAGACNYCHSSGTGSAINPGTDIDSGIYVYGNTVTHHFTGLGNDTAKCEWCHNIWESREYRIRGCEGCHGYESLHNIQVDSDGDGVISPGVELPYFGHIGNPDDCWGCHGYSVSSGPAPVSGPVIPHLGGSDLTIVSAGADTELTLNGSAFTNLDESFEWLSDIVLTSPDGSPVELYPDSISQSSMTVTIPGALAAGNYDLRAKKGDTESNRIVVSIIPEVSITNVECSKKRGVLVITGSGFGEKIEGTDAYINAELNGEILDIISWNDNRIKAVVTGCPGNGDITVNTLFGSYSSSNRPPKPHKGKGY
ncbi:MAG: hypothetical protein AB1499_02320 [Nitrospirota bacterium]